MLAQYLTKEEVTSKSEFINNLNYIQKKKKKNNDPSIHPKEYLSLEIQLTSWRTINSITRSKLRAIHVYKARPRFEFAR